MVRQTVGLKRRHGRPRLGSRRLRRLRCELNTKAINSRSTSHTVAVRSKRCDRSRETVRVNRTPRRSLVQTVASLDSQALKAGEASKGVDDRINVPRLSRSTTG